MIKMKTVVMKSPFLHDATARVPTMEATNLARTEVPTGFVFVSFKLEGGPIHGTERTPDSNSQAPYFQSSKVDLIAPEPVMALVETSEYKVSHPRACLKSLFESAN
jgi:hypothetical protein